VPGSRHRKTKRRGRGEGSVTYNRAKALWQASVQIGLDERGRPKRIYVRAKRKEDVLERLRELHSNRLSGNLSKRSNLNLSSFLDRWLEKTARPRIRIGTYQNYKGLIANKIRPFIGGYRLADVNASHIQSLFDTLERRNESPYRRQQVHSLLFAALRNAVELRLVASNPCQAVRSPKLPSREMNVLDEFQAKKVLDAAAGSRLFALFVVAIATGMRQGELFALKWSDIDLKRGSISIQRTIANEYGRVKVGNTLPVDSTNSPKTKSGKRLVRLPDIATRALRLHKKRMFAERHLTWVFCDVSGGLLRRSNFIRRQWRELLKSANEKMPDDRKIPLRFRFHDLRHTAAALRLAQGDHPKVVQELLGHSKIGVTLDLYSHVMPSLQDESAERMDKTLARLVRKH
jgi:integrase